MFPSSGWTLERTCQESRLQPIRLPVVFIVDTDEAGRVATVSALRRRFGSDYRVMAADSAEAGLAGLEKLAQQDEEMALVEPTSDFPRRTPPKQSASEAYRNRAGPRWVGAVAR